MDQSRRVLLVESDAGFGEEIRGSLSVFNLEVELVGDGTQALQRAKEAPPDLILLCVELPKMSGYSICNKLKKNPTLKDVPLVIMSSEATPDIFDQHRKLKTRAEEYLIKPFDMNELLGKIRPLLDGHVEEDIHIDPPVSTAVDMADLDGDATSILDRDRASDLIAQSQTPEVSDADAIEIDPDELIDETDYIADDPTRINFGQQAEAMRDIATTHSLANEDATNTASVDIDVNVDDQIDLETDAAFARLELETGAQQRADDRPVVITMAEAAQQGAAPKEAGDDAIDIDHDDDVPFEVESPAEAANSVPVSEARARSARASEASGNPHVSHAHMQDTLPGADDSAELARAALGDEAVRPQATEIVLDDHQPDSYDSQPAAAAPPPVPAAAAPAPPAIDADTADKLRDLERQLDQLESENKRLERDLDSERQRAEAAQAQAASAASSSSYSRDRELLSLREVINKKEKEILDLKDDLDAKERQILDHKDKVRELERKARDMDDKFLVVEREMVGAKERLEALEADKQRLVEREEGVKKRLEQAKEEIEKSYTELDELRQRSESEMQQLREEHAEALASAQAAHKSEVEELRAEHEAAQQQASEQHASAVSALEREHEEELQELRSSQAQEVERLRNESERALAERDAEHQSALQTARDEAASAMEQANAAHAAENQELLDKHRGEIARLEEEHESAVASINEAHATAVAELESKHEGEQQALLQQHADETQRMSDEHAQTVRDLEQRHAEATAEARSRHEHEVSELNGTHAAVKADLEGQLAEARDAIADRERQIGEFEAKVAAQEQQLVTAFHKIRHDEQLSDKAQRALAIAITLLEEQKKVSAESTGEPGEAAEGDQPAHN